jgi:hypothetical protein
MTDDLYRSQARDVRRIEAYVLWFRDRQGFQIGTYDPNSIWRSIGEGRGEAEDLLYGPLLRTPLGCGDWDRLSTDPKLVEKLLVQIAWDLDLFASSDPTALNVPGWDHDLVQSILSSHGFSHSAPSVD